MTRPTATPLAFTDEILETLALPGGALQIVRGLGSGLARGDDGSIWAIGDRGPNLKVKLAVRRYGLDHLAAHGEADGAKVMPSLAIGPALSELAIEGDRVTILRTLPLRTPAGDPLSGLPPPWGLTEREPAVALDGTLLAPDPSGADTEGVAVARDGSFWIGEEYGPSLLRVAPDGTVGARLVPEGCADWFAEAAYPIRDSLPALAARRRLNRGFEALALSDDGAALYLAFQSPLAHPDVAAHRRARHVRLWALDTATERVTAQYLYPLDPPRSFARDQAAGDLDRADIKVSELTVLGRNLLLVLERGSLTTKLYAVDLDSGAALDPRHLDPDTRPTIEELSGTGDLDLPVLAKTLILSTDDFPEIDADLEGMVMLSPRQLLLVNDNDFGTEGVATRFWRIDLPFDLPAR
ncbi:esterase-like activity of phytase family protein [Sphingomonas psychrotolerans]|uniref:Phytase-like domain-containing protein n=1 Tax=Sphingomonas psychrotolerans TaxID=1327635 RepID=A0A2K8MH85_9SPHN|nr:esterase-like activity of phytase family protein [Sphingomonas psychrotolerans]ATY32344.1 hypothetical protein CVN68_10420 [Sphingomonas psychrotolerans]